MQSELDNKMWQNKDIRSARQTSRNNSSDIINDAIEYLKIEKDLGLVNNERGKLTIKSLDKEKDRIISMLHTDYEQTANKNFDGIYKGMTPSDAQGTPQDELSQDVKQQNWVNYPVTDGQRRAIYAITRANSDLLLELPGGNENDSFDGIIDNLNKQEASDFIEKHGKKKK